MIRACAQDYLKMQLYHKKKREKRAVKDAQDDMFTLKVISDNAFKTIDCSGKLLWCQSKFCWLSGKEHYCNFGLCLYASAGKFYVDAVDNLIAGKADTALVVSKLATNTPNAPCMVVNLHDYIMIVLPCRFICVQRTRFYKGTMWHVTQHFVTYNQATQQHEHTYDYQDACVWYKPCAGNVSTKFLSRTKHTKSTSLKIVDFHTQQPWLDIQYVRFGCYAAVCVQTKRKNLLNNYVSIQKPLASHLLQAKCAGWSFSC
jgi:hypothetical protein